MLRYTSSFGFTAMKRCILIVSLSFVVPALSHAEGQCNPRWYIGHSVYGGNDTRASFASIIDTTIAAGESIWITVSSQLLCTGDCSLQYPETFTWTHNGETINSTNYLVEDTGLYIGSIRYSSCVTGTYHLYLHVHQPAVTEPATEESPENSIEFYPTVSSGIYNIKSENELIKVQIRNSAGNLVFTSDHNISSVDITRLPEGLYFYYVEDKLRHVQHGKLVKR